MRSLFKLVANICRWGWKLINFIRELVVNLFVLFILLICFGIYIQLHNKHVNFDSGALVLNLVGTIVDQPDPDQDLRKFTRNLTGKANPDYQNSLFHIVETIDLAANDDRITGIVLSLNDFTGADLPTLEYIGKYLNHFKSTGKPIYAISNNYNQSQYLLASYADKIYLEPQGHVDIYGLATQNLYYKSLLDNLKVNTYVFRVGNYKSAVEPYTRDSMSPEARQNTSLWLNEMWEGYLNDISDNRQLLPSQLVPQSQQILQRMESVAGDSTLYAKQFKLVDAIVSRAQFESAMIKQFNWNSDSQNFNQISYYDYQPPESIQNDNSGLEQIAVIAASGTIIDGDSSVGYMGSNSTVQQIRQARLDPKIKALVLRVNSPGGSVSASEAIRSELLAFHAANKPIVVSMGGMAASGGYWISTPADYIFASANTLTGSIGIFGLIPTVQKSLAHIGVYSDGVSTSPLAGISALQDLPHEFTKLMQMNIENGYNRFINIVAKSRHKTPDEIDAIAQGRVWIGKDAQSKGLVDSLGDFDDAILKAAELANLTDYELNWMQTDSSLFVSLFSGVQSWLQTNNLISLLPPQFKQLKQVNLFTDPLNRYAVCIDCTPVH